MVYTPHITRSFAGMFMGGIFLDRQVGKYPTHLLIQATQTIHISRCQTCSGEDENLNIATDTGRLLLSFSVLKSADIIDRVVDVTIIILTDSSFTKSRNV